MNSRILMGITLAMAVFNFTAHASMYWSPAVEKHAPDSHNRHASNSFVLHDGEGAMLQLINPKLASSDIHTEDGKVTIKPTGMDYYHAIVAKRHNGKSTETAIRYLAMFGRPSGRSPSELTALMKSPLEIIPKPLPREHWHYMADSSAAFTLHFAGHPLPHTVVHFHTSYGTDMDLKTDARGIFSLRIPDDFAVVKLGSMLNHPAEMILTTHINKDGHSYSTSLTAAYMADPSHWQSSSMGILLASGGMLLGGIIGWRMKEKKPNRNTRKRGGS